MAIRALPRFRPAVLTRSVAAVAVAGTTLLVAPAIASAAPHSEPSIDSLQKQLGKLAVQNSQLVEEYNQARVQAGRTAAAANAAEVAANHAATSYETVRAQYVHIVQSQYEGNTLGAAGALLRSSSGANYLDRLGTLNMVSTHVSQVVAQVAQVRKKAATSAASAAKLAAAAKTRSAQLSKQRDAVTAKIQQYKDKLARLTSAQQVDYQRAQNPSVSTKSLTTLHLTKAGTAAAQRAVAYALAQVGKPYVFGASGPSSFDCSGLTMMSWRAGGVSLPHSAADQYNYGTHVSRSELQPGDLVFFYQPIGHVTIYIGDGLMVSAPTEGENVSVVPLAAFNSDYVGATRLT